MTAHRRLLAPLCGAIVLLLTVPTVAADLAVTTRAGTTFSIFTHGSTSLSAPYNTTLRPVWNGYLVDWESPSSMSSEVTGYRVYRLPAPGTDGSLQVFTVSPKFTALYDRPGSGAYVYFVTTLIGTAGESIPARPASTFDFDGNYPRCGVVGIYFSPPYYDTNMECLFPFS